MNRTTLAATVPFLLAALAGADAQNQSNPGTWEGPYPLPFRTMHGASLPTGHFHAINREGANQQAVWDPATKTTLFNPVGNTDARCSGHTTMADGRFFIAGGTGLRDANGNEIGLKSAEIYDPATRQWTRLPDMPGGHRWYPSAVALPDSQIMVWAGNSGGAPNAWVDLYNPATNTWTTVSNRAYPEFYPRLHVVHTGEVFVSGGAEPLFYNPTTRAWRNAPTPNVPNRSEDMHSVLLPYSAQATSQKVLILGGGLWTAPLNSAEIFTVNASGSGSWQSIPPMSEGRVASNAVLLPSGEVLVLGGTFAPVGEDWDNLESAEIYSPASNSWRTVAPMTVGRGYHSVAVLLPDGSVAHAGGDRSLASGTTLRQLDMEVYKPWYFTAPSRPSISSAPPEAGYGGSIQIGTPNTNISAVLLIRTASATHAISTDQRAVELPFTASGGTITAQMPASPNLAPPGYYMLFLRDTSGVPSTARFVKVIPGTLPAVTVAATDPAASETGPNTGTFTVMRTGSTASALGINLSIAGTAANGADYAALTNFVTIPSGSSSVTVTVTPVDDTLVEPSETVLLTVTSGGGYTVGSPSSATVAIVDNDTAPPLPTLSITATDAAASEPGTNTGTFTVTRTGSTSAALAVSFTVAGTATSGSDYTSLGTSVTIPVGAASASVLVNPLDDTLVEPAETVVVTISPSSSYTLGTATSSVTIADNDAPVGNGTGLTGEYFGAAVLTGLAFTRTDPRVDFNWGSGSPDSRLGADGFSIRWTGQIEPPTSETYTFVTTSDDGVRLWVNGQLLINNWTDHSATENQGTIALMAGQRVDLRLEYYENSGGAVIRLEWQSASQTRQVIPASQLHILDTDGDGMADAAEAWAGFDSANADQDANGIPDGLDDWDLDGTDNQTELANGNSPGIPPGGGGGGSGGSGCGATGFEVLLLLGLLRRRR